MYICNLMSIVALKIQGDNPVHNMNLLHIFYLICMYFSTKKIKDTYSKTNKLNHM